VKFLVDAQLPKVLSDFINAQGYSSLHTLDLPQKNKTQDRNLSEICEAEGRIIVTKDTEFLDSFLLKRKPAKLLLVKTGNINNPEILNIFRNNLKIIVELFASHSLIELYRDKLVTHQ